MASKDCALGGLSWLLLTLFHDLIEQIKGGELPAIFWIYQLRYSHEGVIVHIKKIIFDAELVANICLSSAALQNLREFEAVLIADEILWHQTQRRSFNRFRNLVSW